MSSIYISSFDCAAATKALAASSGDVNVLWPFCCAVERVATQPVRRTTSAVSFTRSIKRDFFNFSFVRPMGLPSQLYNEDHREKLRTLLVGPPATTVRSS